MINPQYSTNFESGFSLVETLVAITILLLVIIGPLTIVTQTAQSTSFANDQAIAFFVAQEGLELAQKARDDLMLNHFAAPATPWADFTDATTGGVYEDCINNGCGLEIADDGDLASVIDCSNAANCRVYLDTSSGVVRSRYTYTATGNTQTPFTRVITFTPSSDEVRVVSRVTWRTGNLRDEQSVEVVSYLFNTYDAP